MWCAINSMCVVDAYGTMNHGVMDGVNPITGSDVLVSLGNLVL